MAALAREESTSNKNPDFYIQLSREYGVKLKLSIMALLT